ncbi:hypothetical protein PAPHI01_0908 [Pancytospora philotis]|nr:hypothetical protein PAPHI01_0908 [Pancytospora philotis]
MAMNSDILLEVSKYVEQPVDSPELQEALDSAECSRLKFASIRALLDRKMRERPSIEELQRRNIIKNDQLCIAKIHEMLVRINFKSAQERRIAPGIASRIKSMDYKLKRKLLIKQLGLCNIDKAFKEQ